MYIAIPNVVKAIRCLNIKLNDKKFNGVKMSVIYFIKNNYKIYKGKRKIGQSPELNYIKEKDFMLLIDEVFKLSQR